MQAQDRILFEHLTTAIACLENALDIYEAKDVFEEFEKN